MKKAEPVQKLHTSGVPELSRPEPAGKCQGTGWLLEDAGGSQCAKRCGVSATRIKQALVDQSNIPGLPRLQPRHFESTTIPTATP